MDHSSTGISAENLRPGSAAWRVFAADPLQIEGYATASSLAAGETLGLCVNCLPGIVRFRIDYYRMGCYGGLGGRLVRSVDDVVAVRQPMPFLDRARWLAECDWSPSDEFVVPDDWCSGVYVAVLSTIPADPVDMRSSYVPFVVRDDKRPHQLVYQLPPRLQRMAAQGLSLLERWGHLRESIRLKRSQRRHTILCGVPEQAVGAVLGFWRLLRIRIPPGPLVGEGGIRRFLHQFPRHGPRLLGNKYLPVVHRCGPRRVLLWPCARSRGTTDCARRFCCVHGSQSAALANAL